MNWADPRETDDPAFLGRSIELVLAQYPEDIQETVANPACQVLGTIRTSARMRGEYLPFVELVRRACEELYGPTRRRLQREEQSRQQFAERDENERKSRPKQTYEKFCAEMAARGMPIKKEHRPHGETVAKVMEKYNLTQEQWDALKDLPKEIADKCPDRWDLRDKDRITPYGA